MRRFTQPGNGSVNTWILEGEETVVVIDTQRSLSAGREAAAQVAAIGKPVAAILLTHPHPDHFGGLQSFLEVFPDAPVYASEATGRVMANDENGLVAATKAVLGSDAPDQQPLPTRFFNDGQEIVYSDIRLIVDDIGQGEAATMSMFYASSINALFTGDVVDNAMTPFMMEGHTVDWLAQIEAISNDYGERDPTIFPGHGAQGSMALFDEMQQLISWVHRQIKKRATDGLDDAEIVEILAEYNARYRNYPPVAAIPNLMRENIRVVAAELGAR
ncbi:MAG: MBL fold metallo-hydrolase [Pseudomonadota bacterium]